VSIVNLHYYTNNTRKGLGLHNIWLNTPLLSVFVLFLPVFAQSIVFIRVASLSESDSADDSAEGENRA